MVEHHVADLSRRSGPNDALHRDDLADVRVLLLRNVDRHPALIPVRRCLEEVERLAKREDRARGSRHLPATELHRRKLARRLLRLLGLVGLPARGHDAGRARRSVRTGY
eukprot:194532-Rhodomonas_salina.1